MRLVKGYTSISVKGLNIEKLINRLIKEGVPVYSASRKEHKRLDFCVEYKCRKKVIACLENLCYNYQITGDFGLMPLFGMLLRRAGLIAGCALICFAAFFSTFYVADIRVSGCKSIDPESIKGSVGEMGAAGFSLGRPAASEIEKSIYEKYHGVSFVSASYRGLVLYIKVVEAEPVPVVISSEPKNIVSSYDGKISRLIVYRGTALVKAGDTVKKGQVIIGGYREKPDGERIPVRAMGEAYGMVELTYTETFEGVRTELSRTGRFIEQSHIDFLGLVFPVKKPQAAYTTYETETESCYIYYNFFLPARLITVRHYETELVTVKEDFEKVRKVVIEEAERKALELAEKEGRVTGSSTVVRQEGETRYIDVTVRIEKSFIINGE